MKAGDGNMAGKMKRRRGVIRCAIPPTVGKNVFLKLSIKAQGGWTTHEQNLREVGYGVDDE